MITIQLTAMIHEYKGYSIRRCTDGWEFWKTSEGCEPEFECDGDGGWRNCGNTRYADSLDNAKDEINDILIEQTPTHEIFYEGRYYEFSWITDAWKFMKTFGGEPKDCPQTI